MPNWKTPVRFVPFLGTRIATFFRYPQGLTVVIYREGKSPYAGLRATPYPGVRSHTFQDEKDATTILRGGYANLISREDAALLRAEDERWDKHIVEEDSDG